MRNRYGSVKKLGDNYYHVFWTENGKRRSKRIHGTDNDVTVFLAQKTLGTNAVGNVTYGEYWDIAVVPTFTHLSERTIYDYNRVWNVELAPRIQNKSVEETTWRYVQDVLDTMSSRSAQSYAFRLWRKICNLAVRDGILASNPVDRNIRIGCQKVAESCQIYSHEEIMHVLDVCQDYKHSYLLVLELCAGLRHEEACAVTRDDITLEDDWAIVSVSKALTSVGGTKVVKDTKTVKSRRSVALAKPFADYLMARLDYVPKSVEEQSSPVTISRNFKQYCDRRGVRYVPFGKMRSSFATVACECCDSSLVSMVMGHSDGSTRGDYYQQLTLEASKIVGGAFAVRCGAM